MVIKTDFYLIHTSLLPFMLVNVFVVNASIEIKHFAYLNRIITYLLTSLRDLERLVTEIVIA